MRKIIVSNLISVDGYFEGLNQDISWFKVDEEFFGYARNLLNNADILLFGRITYQQMAAYWPFTKDDDAVITEKMNSLEKIVLSKTIENPEWNNTKIVSEKADEELQKIKEQPGKDIVIFGSGTIVSAFTQCKLIDEYRLIINPVILGNGSPMFRSVNERLNLKLVDTKSMANGIVILTYHPER